MDFNAARIHPQLFGNMVLLARRRCKFFPTIAEMMDFCRELRAIEQRKAMEFKALPEPEMSEEVSEQGIARIRKLFELAESGMTIEEMENEMVRFVSDN